MRTLKIFGSRHYRPLVYFRRSGVLMEMDDAGLIRVSSDVVSSNCHSESKQYTSSCCDTASLL